MKHTGFTLSRNEWLVMEALWERPSTLMELVRQLGQEPPGWAKSTTATMVRRMEEKGLIRHEAGSKARVYHPAAPCWTKPLTAAWACWSTPSSSRTP